MLTATLAGRCANARQLGHGETVHVLLDYSIDGFGEISKSPALCGAKPARRSLGWDKQDSPATCEKCLVKLAKVTQ